MDASDTIVNEIEKALKQLMSFAINTRCQGVSAPSMIWTMPSRPTYLVRQKWNFIIKISILKS